MAKFLLIYLFEVKLTMPLLLLFFTLLVVSTLVGVLLVIVIIDLQVLEY